MVAGAFSRIQRARCRRLNVAIPMMLFESTIRVERRPSTLLNSHFDMWDDAENYFGAVKRFVARLEDR
jgi:hypothetical protein